MSHRITSLSIYGSGPILLASAILFGHPTFAPAQTRSMEEQRDHMVDDYLVREGIKNQAVLKSMRTVPRHLFCPVPLRAQAYFDQALPIGQKQTISPPFIVAYMTETIDPQPTDKVLEIGTGSGYQAAVLSGLVKDVYTIEIVESLGKNAAEVLKKLKYTNVHTRIGDGFKGWPEAAPFDKIIVTCSPENVPQPLIDQLREGGKLMVPIGERFEQVFYLFEKKNGELVKTKLLPALFVPMTGVAEDNRKVKPDPLNPEVNNGSFERDDDDDGRPEGWHYQRLMTLETGGAPDGKKFVTFRNDIPGRAAIALQGMAVDGSKVGALTISMKVKGQDMRYGPTPLERPSFVIQFYDSNRGHLDPVVIGPWQGSFDWKSISQVVHVPPKAREAIIRIGLNGSTGEISFDDVRIKANAR